MNAVAEPLLPSIPLLRQELRIESGAPLVNGAPSWTLFDPVRHMFFQLGKIEFAIFSRWASGQIDQIGPDLAQTGMADDEIDAAFGRTVEFSISNSLTVTPMGDSVATMQKQRDSAKKAWWKWAVDNYLFVRIPLVKPADFLERTLPNVAWIWSRGAVMLFAFMALTGLFLVSRQWDSFMASFMYFFSWQGLIAYGLGLFAVKILHELGHAYTATRFGCRVPSMGISLLVMMPVLYTDTTGAWRLKSRKNRLMIDCAGVSAELMVASVATLLWVALPDGMMRSVAFVLATTSWVLSLGINLNPFMRFDGYYVLSDLLGVPNLQPRAFALGRWRLRELLFDLGDAPPEDVPQKLRRGLIVYAWITWIYRLILFLGIAFLVYHLFFKLLGIILFAIEMVVFIGRPIIQEMAVWVAMKERILQTARGRRWPWIVGTVVVLCLLPLDRHISAPAVLSPIGVAPIVSGDPARIDKMWVRNGQQVAAGAPLMTLFAPELENAAAATRVRIAQLQLQYDRAGADREDMSNHAVIERELKRERDALAGLDTRKDRLVLRAPLAGIVTDIGSDVHVGRWLGGSEILANIVTPNDYDVQAFVAEADMARLGPGAEGRFIANDAVLASRAVKLVERSANAISTLDQPLLASVHGGDIAVDEKQGTLTPRSSLYRLRLLATKNTNFDQLSVQPVAGIVQISAEGKSAASWLFNYIAVVFRQEASLNG